MKIVINDANILIDLAELGMLSDFFQLTFEFRTTNLILDELFDEQYAELIPFIESGNIIVDEISIDELAEIVAIRAKSQPFRNKIVQLFIKLENTMQA